jgi:ribosomal protein L29
MGIENVCVCLDDAAVWCSPDAGAPDHTHPTPSADSTISIPHTFSRVIPIQSSPENASFPVDNDGRHPNDRQRIVDMVHELREQFSTIIQGSWHQSNFIVANEKTIAEQRQELEQVKGELDELRMNKKEQAAIITELRGEVQQTNGINGILQRQVEQTNTVNANLQGQVNEMRAELTQLRTFLLSFAQGRLQHDHNVPGSSMEVDFLNEGAWLR